MEDDSSANTHASGIFLFAIALMSFVLLFMIALIFIGQEDAFYLDGATAHSILVSRARVLASLDAVCIINLTEGFNLFSSACVSNASSLSEELAYIYQDYDAIYTYDDSSLNKWSVYIPDAPHWVVQGIHSIDDRKGYIVAMRRDQSLVIPGKRFVPRAVEYPEGFGLIGIPSMHENASINLFAPNNNSLLYIYALNDTIMHLDPMALDYLNYTVLTGIGELQTIMPDMGLWFYANDTGAIDVTWQ
jgi:hypothetical protein